MVALPAPQGTITLAEILTPYDRGLVESLLRAVVSDHYGCREVSGIAAYSGERKGMHADADRRVAELVGDHTQPAPSGEVGRVVVTDLLNYPMPLIRYSIETTSAPGADGRPRGQELPLVAETVGRYADILTTPEGQFVRTSALTTIRPKIAGLCECQLVQKAVIRRTASPARERSARSWPSSSGPRWAPRSTT